MSNARFQQPVSAIEVVSRASDDALLHEGHARVALGEDIDAVALDLAIRSVVGEQPKTDDVPITLASKSSRQNAVHAAADAHLAKFKVAVRYAFAKGRGAMQDINSISTASETLHAASGAPKAIHDALLDVLPPTLLATLVAGGQAGLTLLASNIKKLTVVDRVAGGKGSGNFGHEGRPGEVGGSGDSEASTAIMARYQNEQASNEPMREYMESKGLSLENYQRVNELLYSHNVSSGVESDHKLSQLWNSDTKDGQALRALSHWNEWQVEHTSHASDVNWDYARKAIEKDPSSYKIFEGADQSGSVERFKEYMTAVERGEPIFYRAGPLDKAAISTTTNPHGATSGSSHFTPDRWFTFRELKSQGYHLLAGARGMVGVTSSQESEYIWLKPDKSMRVAADFTDMKFDAKDPIAAAWAREHAAELAKDLSDTTEQAIKDAVARSFEDPDYDRADLEDDILDAVGDDDRAELIARTETMRAANEGQRQSWDQAVDKGLLEGDEKREWIVAEDACPECDVLDGQLADLDGQYPDDGGDGPPLHPNCRCTEGISSRDE